MLVPYYPIFFFFIGAYCFYHLLHLLHEHPQNLSNMLSSLLRSITYSPHHQICRIIIALPDVVIPTPGLLW